MIATVFRDADQGSTGAVWDDVLCDKDLGMNPSSAIVAPATSSATTDSGRIRLGGGWRLVPAKPAAR